MGKKILFVATRQFWQTATGKEITLYNNCKGLHYNYGYEIFLFCFADKNTDKNKEPPKFIKDVMYADTPGIICSIGTVLKKSFIFEKFPIQCSMFYNKKIAEKLNEYYRKTEPDAIIIDMVRLAPYIDTLPDTSINKILIEDDLLAERYRKQMATVNGGNVAGYFSGNIPGILNKIFNLKFIKNIILKTEIKRLTGYEKKLSEKFDFITFISPEEAREFNKINHTDKAITLTMGADVQYYAKGQSNRHEDKSLSIVGNFHYAPNAVSIEWICKNIIPRLSDSVKYYVVGKIPDKLKNRLLNPKISFLGYIDDIRPIIKSTEIYFSPILYGTGIKTKIVEAMAMGMAVVTNSVGAEGLNVKNGRELFIADDIDEMIKIIENLFDNPELRQRVGKCGQQFVMRYHDWDKVYETFGEMGL